MALDNEEFYTIDGQKIDRSVLVQKMIDYYNNKYPDTNITDFNEGSEIRNLLEAIASDVYHLELNDQQLLGVSFLSTSYGTWLDLFGEELNTPRQLAQVAWGTVTFSISEAVNYNIDIPQGTILVSETTGLYYATNMTVQIPIGETSVTCPCYSQVPGASANAEANTITLFKDANLYNEVTITNNEAFTEGRDMENDDDYRARLLEVKGQDNFGSREYYTRLGTSVTGVHDVAITSSASHTGKVLVNPYTKPLSNTILAEVTAEYSNADNLVYNHSFEVAETSYTTAPLEISVGVTDEVSDTIFTNLLSLFFNGGTAVINNTPMTYPGLNIEQEVTNYTLMTLLETLPFVVQVTSITSNNSTFSKLTPGTNKALKLGTVSITQTVVD